MPTTPQSTQYEIDRVNRNRMARAEAARQQRLHTFCQDREEAIRLDSQTEHVQSQVTAFDDPQSDFSFKVKSARKWLRWLLFTAFAVVLISNADFWLAMPDVSENLANKATSLIVQIQDKISGTASELNKSAFATPVALRVGIGITVVCIWLALTLGWKACTDTEELRQSAAALVPGDDEGHRRIQQSILLRRVGRIGYMVILGGLFCYLYTFDLQRARTVVALGQMEDVATTTIEWPDFGVGISNGELETDEATPKLDSPAQKIAPVDSEQAARNLARPQVLVYALLAMLHGLLLVIPTGQRPDDFSLTSFDRGQAERGGKETSARAGTIYRSLGTRIQQAAPEEKESLLAEAIPVARRINESLGWTFIEEPTAPASGATARPIPVVNEPSVAETSGMTELAQNELSSASQENTEPRRQAPQSGIRPDEPEDPYQAIFG
jgi:hypothetical protein